MATEKIRRLKNAERTHAPKRRKDKKPTDRNPYAGWAHFYKITAVIGVIAVMLPYIRLLFTWGARRYATILSVAATVLMLGMGYLVQILVLGKDRKILDSAWDFTYEAKKLKLPLWRVILACLLSAGLAIAIGRACEKLVFHLLRDDFLNPANAEVGGPLLVAGFVITAVVGCILVPFRPHQLLSTRTMLEFCALLAFPMAFDTFWGGGSAPDITISVIVYIFCMSVVMNQEAVIKPAYGSTTCVATHAIRRAGLLSVLGFMLRTLLLTIPALGTVSVFVTSFRALLFSGDFVKTFDFPFSGFPIVNAILFAVTFLIWFAVALFYCLNRTPEERAAFLAKLAAWWERVVDFILTKLGLRDVYAAGQGRFEPVPRNFTDTVTSAPQTEEAPLTYRAFVRKLKAMDDTDERFAYAWRTMVSHLCAAHRDISPALTPLEMADILEQTTTVQDIRRLTGIFLDVTYAEKQGTHATEEDVAAVMAILEERW